MKSIFCLFLCFLAVNYALSLSIEKVSILDSETDATWNDFQTRHVVDGTAPANAVSWNNLLRNRIGSQYGTKTLNSFVVSTTSAILTDFSNETPRYTGSSSTNLYWSAASRRIYVMNLSGQPGGANPNYKVYDCGRKYYVAWLDMSTRRPVHFQGQSTTQGGSLDGAIQGCTIVN